jgi:sugar-specific transcriptional regulator TrmB
VRRGALCLHRDRVVDEVLGQPERDDVGRNRRRIGPHSTPSWRRASRRSRPGRPARYTAAPPDEALGKLVAQRRSELEQLELDVAHTIARLTPAYRDGRDENDPLSFIEVLREPAAIARRFAELEASVEREILVFTKPPHAVEPAENVEGPKLLERRIEARSV